MNDNRRVAITKHLFRLTRPCQIEITLRKHKIDEHY
jgi:hypothetical protein